MIGLDNIEKTPSTDTKAILSGEILIGKRVMNPTPQAMQQATYPLN